MVIVYECVCKPLIFVFNDYCVLKATPWKNHGNVLYLKFCLKSISTRFVHIT